MLLWEIILWKKGIEEEDLNLLGNVKEGKKYQGSAQLWNMSFPVERLGFMFRAIIYPENVHHGCTVILQSH